MSQVFSPPIVVGTTLSDSLTPINDAFDALQTNFIGSSDPTSILEDGMIWPNTTVTAKLKGRASGVTFEIGDWGVSNLGHLRKDGTIPLTADWNVGAFRITNLATPTGSSDAATKATVDLRVLKVGDTITGTLITNLGVAGDPIHQFVIPSGATWSLGIDDSDSDAFKIQPASTLGGAVGVAVTTTGNLGVGIVTPVNPLHIEHSVAGISTIARFNNANATGRAQFHISSLTGPFILLDTVGGLGYVGLSSDGLWQVFGGQTDNTATLVIDTSTGRLFIKQRSTAPTDGDIANSHLNIWMNESTNNLTIRIRKSDGTYRTATIATT